MKRTLYLLSMWALLLLTGCNDPKHVTGTLTRAEALMNEHPDSVWAMLNTLSPDDMGQKRTRALYALLYTQAQDKNYIDETNDSLISVAVDYYRDTDDVRHKFLSYYYKGRVHFNAEDYLNGTTCYMEAEQLADEVEDDYLKGLLYAELGRIYRLYYDYPKSLEAYLNAAECYERAGKIRHRNYMWLNQVRIYRNMNEYDEAERLLRMTLDAAKELEDNTLIKSCLGDWMMLCIEQKNMAKARSIYAESLSFVDEDYGSSSFMSALTQMYASERDFVQARKYLEKGWNRATNKTDSVNLYLSSADLYRMLGKNELAYQELEKGALMQNQDTRQALQQPVLTVQRDYLSDKLEFEAYRLQMEKRLKLLYILFFVFVLSAVVYGFIRVLKKNKKVISELENKKEQVEKNKRELEEENLKIRSLLQRMDGEKNRSDQTIKDLKNEIAKQEKENNEEISGLVQKLEDENKANAKTITSLRESLSYKETVYQQYEQKIEKVQKDLQDAVDIKSEHISVLLKDKLEFMGEWILLYGEQLTLKNYKEKKIQRRIEDTRARFFKGKDAFRNLERLVNLYQDNAMQYFREEIQLADEKDYCRVCCLFAGIPPHIIAWMLDEKTDVIYQRKTRLRKKMASFPCLHQSLFLRLLSK